MDLTPLEIEMLGSSSNQKKTILEIVENRSCFKTEYNGKTCIKLQKTTTGGYWCNKYKKDVGNMEEKYTRKVKGCNA
jgi:hypothetical protein